MQNESKEALSKRKFEDVLKFYLDLDSKSIKQPKYKVIRYFVEEELAGLGSSDVVELPADLMKKIVFDGDVGFRKDVLFPSKDKELELLNNLTDQEKFMMLKVFIEKNNRFDCFSDEFKNKAKEILGAYIESENDKHKRLIEFFEGKGFDEVVKEYYVLEEKSGESNLPKISESKYKDHRIKTKFLKDKVFGVLSSFDEINKFKGTSSDLQKKVFRDVNFKFFSFAFLSEEVQIDILNNLNDQDKHAILKGLDENPNFFLFCSPKVKNLAKKYFDIEVNGKIDLELSQIADNDGSYARFLEFHEKLLSYAGNTTGEFCYLKSAVQAFKMYEQNKEYVEDESGWENLLSDAEKDLGNKPESYDECQIGVKILSRNKNIDSLSVDLREDSDKGDNRTKFHVFDKKFFDNEKKFSYGSSIRMKPITDIIMSGKPVVIRKPSNKHNIPIKNSFEIRSSFAKDLLHFFYVRSLIPENDCYFDYAKNYYRQTETTRNHNLNIYAGTIAHATIFLHIFCDDVSMDNVSEKMEIVEAKLIQTFMNVPNKCKSYKLLELCEFIIQEYEKTFIDNWSQNKDLSYSEFLFDKIDEFKDKFLSGYEKFDKTNDINKLEREINSLKTELESKKKEIDSLKTQPDKKTEDNNFELNKQVWDLRKKIDQKEIEVRNLKTELEKPLKENKKYDKVTKPSEKEISCVVSKSRNIFDLYLGIGETVFGTAGLVFLLFTMAPNFYVLIPAFLALKGVCVLGVSVVSMKKTKGVFAKLKSENKIAKENKSDDKKENDRNF